MQYDLENMTRQEVFDAVCKHLLTQKRQSKAHPSDHPASSQCMYRSYDGLKCAAGIFIDDDVYNAHYHEIEDKKWTHLVKKKFVSGNHSELIRSLQLIHDNKSPSEWEYELRSYAEYQHIRSGISYPSLVLEFNIEKYT